MSEYKFRTDGDDLSEMRSVDVEPIIEAARATTATGDGDMRHAAKIPGVVIEAYCTRAGITFHEFMNSEAHIRRMLNDPDNGAFRIWKGKV